MLCAKMAIVRSFGAVRFVSRKGKYIWNRRCVAVNEQSYTPILRVCVIITLAELTHPHVP